MKNWFKNSNKTFTYQEESGINARKQQQEEEGWGESPPRDPRGLEVVEAS